MATNIVNAVFGGSKETVTRKIRQWDYGMLLVFSGLELPQSYEVHFANTEFSGNAKTQIGDENGVNIPDEYLITGEPVYAWLYLHTGADDGETVYSVKIPVVKRAMPTHEEPTPVQQSEIEQALAALNSAVEQTAADVVTSGENAQAAETSAEAAEQAKDDAVEAKDKAVEAKNSAETAQSKAEDAQRAAEQAAGSVLGLTADATVDANVGTPSVEVDVITETGHKKMSFAFRNMKGEPGKDGEDGEDGFSPTVSVSDITGGHRVSITDKTGTQDFDVMNGEKGDTGLPGSNPISFTATLLSASWSSSALTISDQRLISSGYTYMVSASSSSTRDYQDADIYADDVTTDGQMTFHCVETPTSDLTVNIIRLELGE